MFCKAFLPYDVFIMLLFVHFCISLETQSVMCSDSVRGNSHLVIHFLCVKNIQHILYSIFDCDICTTQSNFQHIYVFLDDFHIDDMKCSTKSTFYLVAILPLNIFLNLNRCIHFHPIHSINF